MFEVAHLPTHGGSLRIFASPTARSASAALRALRQSEADWGLGTDAFYLGFNTKVADVLAGFRVWLAAQADIGRKVAAYGAAAKGNTFLNAAKATASDLLAVADLSAAKQGRLLPGSHVPVVAPADLLALAPDDILILPWNIADEIKQQLRAAGFRGNLWTAVPEMRSL